MLDYYPSCQSLRNSRELISRGSTVRNSRELFIGGGAVRSSWELIKGGVTVRNSRELVRRVALRNYRKPIPVFRGAVLGNSRGLIELMANPIRLCTGKFRLQTRILVL